MRRTLQNLWRGSGPRRGRWAYFPQGEGSTPSYRTNELRIENGELRIITYPPPSAYPSKEGMAGAVFELRIENGKEKTSTL